MTRPLRLEFPGALYHVTSRGNRREDIYLGDDDRELLLTQLANVCLRFNWAIHSYCLMTNHYHLVVETPDGNLSKGMRQLNGVYGQMWNRLHDRVGHVFQGRFKCIVVQKESYLLELSRYVVLNPVRAGIVQRAEDWPWSNLRAILGGIEAPRWLASNWLLSHFGQQRRRAVANYLKFVNEGVGRPSPLAGVRFQGVLGDDRFVAGLRCEKQSDNSLEIPRIQRRLLAKPLPWYEETHETRTEAMAFAYFSGAYSMREIADYFGVHYRTVSRAVREIERSRMSECQT